MKNRIRILIAVAMLAFAASSFAQSQQIRGVQSFCSATFTSASGTAYTAGDAVGTSQVLTNAADAPGRIVTLSSVHIHDSAGQNKGLKLLFFDGSAPSLTDNAAFAFGSSLSHLVGVLDIDPADYTSLDSKGVLTRTFLDIRMRLSSTSQNLSVCAVTTSTPTYGVSGTVTVDFHFTY